jgi:drug/metabolite transporter (DMT)-like permease
VIDSTRGILAMSASVVVFIFNDALMKLASEAMPPIQAIGLRGILATGWCMVALAVRGEWRGARRLLHPAVALRGSLEAAAAISYLVPLAFIPFAIATAINLSTPLFLAVLAVLLLGEQVGWRRWTAVAVGFVGVIIMLDPLGLSFHAMSLVVLGATFCYSVSTVLVRVNSRHDSDAATLFWFSVVTSVVSFGAAIPDWVWPSAIDWVWLLTLGLLGGVAQVLVTRAWRLAPAAVLAPFDYAGIVMAVLYGYLWFKEQPSWTVWLGLPLVIGSGLYILYRERIRARGKGLEALA